MNLKTASCILSILKVKHKDTSEYEVAEEFHYSNNPYFHCSIIPFVPDLLLTTIDRCDIFGHAPWKMVRGGKHDGK